MTEQSTEKSKTLVTTLQTLARQTELTVAEIAQIHLSDLNLAGKQPQIRFTPKGEEAPKTVELNIATHRALVSWLVARPDSTGDFLFPGEVAGAMDVTAIQQLIEQEGPITSTPKSSDVATQRMAGPTPAGSPEGEVRTSGVRPKPPSRTVPPQKRPEGPPVPSGSRPVPPLSAPEMGVPPPGLKPMRPPGFHPPSPPPTAPEADEEPLNIPLPKSTPRARPMRPPQPMKSPLKQEKSGPAPPPRVVRSTPSPSLKKVEDKAQPSQTQKASQPGTSQKKIETQRMEGMPLEELPAGPQPAAQKSEEILPAKQPDAKNVEVQPPLDQATKLEGVDQPATSRPDKPEVKAKPLPSQPVDTKAEPPVEQPLSGQPVKPPVQGQPPLGQTAKLPEPSAPISKPVEPRVETPPSSQPVRSPAKAQQTPKLSSRPPSAAQQPIKQATLTAEQAAQAKPTVGLRLLISVVGVVALLACAVCVAGAIFAWQSDLGSGLITSLGLSEEEPFGEASEQDSLLPDEEVPVVGDSPLATPTPTLPSTFTPTPLPPTATPTPLPTDTPTVVPSETPVPTDTPVATDTPEPTPTEPPTAPAEPTDTPTPEATSTPAMKYGAPVLLEPEDGFSFIEGNTVVLRWQPVGELAPDEQYAVRMVYQYLGETTYQGTNLQETEWTVPLSLYGQIDPPENRYEWFVVVERVNDDGSATAISPESAWRTFVWK